MLTRGLLPVAILGECGVCRAMSEGGQRCAAHTRPALAAATAAVRAAADEADRDAFFAAQEVWERAAVEYASTPEGLAKLARSAEQANTAGQVDAAALLDSVIRRGQAMREANQEARVVMHAVRLLQDDAPGTGAAQPAPPVRASNASQVIVWDDEDEPGRGWQDHEHADEHPETERGNPTSRTQEEFDTTAWHPGPDGSLSERTATLPITGKRLTPEQAVNEEGLRALINDSEGLFTGSPGLRHEASPGRPGSPITASPDGYAAGTTSTSRVISASARDATSPIASAHTVAGPEVSYEQHTEAHLNLTRTRKAYDEHVEHLEAALAERLDGLSIRELSDPTTGAKVETAGGVNYAQWNKEAAQRDIAAAIAQAQGHDPEQVKTVIGNYTNYAAVDRFRTRELRALGLRADSYATGTQAPRTVNITYTAPTANPPAMNSSVSLTRNLVANRARLDALRRNIGSGGTTLRHVQQAPLADAVRTVAAAKRLQDRYREASERVEDGLIARSTGRPVLTDGPRTGVLHTPQRNRRWDADRTTAALIGHVARQSNVDEATTSSIIGHFRKVAPISSFRVRSLPEDVSVNAHSTWSTPRTRLRWTDPQT